MFFALKKDNFPIGISLFSYFFTTRPQGSFLEGPCAELLWTFGFWCHFRISWFKKRHPLDDLFTQTGVNKHRPRLNCPRKPRDAPCVLEHQYNTPRWLWEMLARRHRQGNIINGATERGPPVRAGFLGKGIGEGRGKREDEDGTESERRWGRGRWMVCLVSV